jgi:hypothetical protein
MATPNATAPATASSQSARVTVSIGIPSAQMAAAQPKLQNASSETRSAIVAVSGSRVATVTTPLQCQATGASRSCTGTVLAPIGGDTFTVTLFTGANGSGTSLMTGATTQGIVSGSNDQRVLVTFNPIVASAQVVIDAASVPPVFLYPNPANADCVAQNGGSCGYTQVPLDLIAKDAEGNTIVGPGIYEDASGDPLTLTLVDSDPTGTALAGPSSFKEPGAGTPRALLTFTGAAIPDFDDPYVSVRVANGTVPVLTGIDVPVAPNDQGQGTVSWSGLDPTENVTSLSGSDVTLINYGTSIGVALGGNLSDLESPIDPSFAFATNGFLTESSYFGGTAFFFEENGSDSPPNRLAAIPTGGCASDSCNGFPVSYNLAASVAGRDGNLWFGEAGALGSIQAIVNGSGTTLFAFVYAANRVYLEQITATGAVTEMGSFALAGGVNIAGYSPADAHLYVVGASDSTIDRIDPSNASAVTILAASQNGHLNAAFNHNPMTALASDGSLVYVGMPAASCNVSVPCGDSIVHIVPGRLPNQVSILPALPSGVSQLNGSTQSHPTFVSQLWSIDADGSITTSVGGNVHAIVW